MCKIYAGPFRTLFYAIGWLCGQPLVPRVGVTLEAEIYEQLKAIAKTENRSLSNLIESWVLAELAKRKA